MILTTIVSGSSLLILANRNANSARSFCVTSHDSFVALTTWLKSYGRVWLLGRQITRRLNQSKGSLIHSTDSPEKVVPWTGLAGLSSAKCCCTSEPAATTYSKPRCCILLGNTIYCTCTHSVVILDSVYRGGP